MRCASPASIGWRSWHSGIAVPVLQDLMEAFAAPR